MPRSPRARQPRENRATLATGSLDDRAEEAAAAALAAAPAPDPPGVPDLMLDGLAHLLAGERPAGTALLERALAQGPAGMLAVPPQLISLACLEVWDISALIAILSHRVEKARADGEVTPLIQALGPLALAYLAQGRLRAAAALLGEAEALASGVGMPPFLPRVHLAALRGDATDARAVFDRVVADASTRGEGLLVRYTAYCEAMLHNALGRYAAAREVLARVPTFAGLPQRELVEAAARTGEHGVAEDAFDQLRECTQAARTDWARGVEASSSALLADGADADARHRDGINHLERSGCKTDECRARLLYGEWLRREGQRLDARAQLRAAHEGFAAMGALAFADRALQELRATGERARRRTPEITHEPHRKSCTSRASSARARRPRKWRPSSSSARAPSTHICRTSSASSTSRHGGNCAEGSCRSRHPSRTPEPATAGTGSGG